MSSYINMRLRRIRRLQALATLARMEGISRRGKKMRFHRQDRYRYDRRRYFRCRYALRAAEPAWIPVRQIEAGARAIKRCVRRWAKIWVLSNNVNPVIISNTETRIDYTDKGNPKHMIRTYWVCLIQPDDTLYELSSRVSITIARRAFARAAYRMPIKTNFAYISSPV